MTEERLILDQQLSHFEAEKRSVGDRIQEVNRRLAVLDEVDGWKLKTPEQEDSAEYPATDQMENDAEEEIEWASEPVIRYSRKDGGP